MIHIADEHGFFVVGFGDHLIRIMNHLIIHVISSAASPDIRFGRLDPTNNRPVETVAVLYRRVSVPPESPPLANDAKFICEIPPRWNPALRNPGDAVHPSRVSLVDAVPVDSRARAGHEIGDMDSDFKSLFS